MALDGKLITSLTESDLQGLIHNAVAEGKTIDYKSGPVGRTDGDKKEFLYDVSSFANASGGHIIFGMAEAQGLPTEIVGLPGIDPDAEISRMDEMVRDGIRPPVPGYQSAAVGVSKGGAAIVVHIPRSWNPPHQVIYQKSFQFYGRGSNGKYRLHVDELRSLLASGPQLAERIRAWRTDRLMRIEAGETPVPVQNEPKLILHLVPLSAFALQATTDVNVYALEQHVQLVIPRWAGGGLWHRPNLDGFLVHAPVDPQVVWYTQVFRNGCIEMVDWLMISGHDGQRWLNGTETEKQVISNMDRLIRASTIIGSGVPAILFLTLTGTMNTILENERGYSPQRGASGFDRNIVVFPEVLFEDLQQPLPLAARPLIDSNRRLRGTLRVG